MCGVHMYVCKCEEITTPRLPLSLSLPSSLSLSLFRQVLSLCLMITNWLGCQVNPDDLSISAPSALGVQVCPTVPGCYVQVLGTNLGSSRLHSKPFTHPLSRLPSLLSVVDAGGHLCSSQWGLT